MGILKKFLIFLSVAFVFTLAINDLFDRIAELDKMANSYKTEYKIQINKAAKYVKLKR